MRLVNRVLAFLAAVALACLGAGVALEVIAVRLGADPVLVHWPVAYGWAERNTWHAGSVKLVFALTAVAGLILLVSQLKPRRPSRLPIAADNPATDAALTRRGLAAAIRAAAGEVDGIGDSSVRVRRRRVQVTATSAGASPQTAADLRGALTKAVDSRLDALQLKPRPRASVRVSTRSR